MKINLSRGYFYIIYFVGYAGMYKRNLEGDPTIIIIKLAIDKNGPNLIIDFLRISPKTNPIREAKNRIHSASPHPTKHPIIARSFTSPPPIASFLKSNFPNPANAKTITAPTTPPKRERKIPIVKKLVASPNIIPGRVIASGISSISASIAEPIISNEKKVKYMGSSIDNPNFKKVIRKTVADISSIIK